MKIAVLMGGNSEEREVSLSSGAEVARALREAGHDVVAVDTTRGVLSGEEEDALLASGVQVDPPAPDALDLLDTGDTTALTRAPEVAETDLLFLALHGGSGEDGTLQTLLELTGLPFVGSGPVGCALAMDKDLTKRLLRDEEIPTPDWMMAPAMTDEVVARLGLPVIVKPVSGGSTLGLTLVRRPDEIHAAVNLAFEYDDQVMFEAFVSGREVTVGILGDVALPVGEIIPAHELFDYECKYQPGMAEEIFPADLPQALASHIQELALKVHRILRLREFSRVDFVLDGAGVPWCLEANSLPGLTSNSLLPKAARAAGIPFPDLCHRIAMMAVERVRKGSLFATGRTGTRSGSGGREHAG
jgi:D-alanine-D-alanine ligase